MSAPSPPVCSPTSAFSAEPPQEYAEIPPADNTPQVRMNEEIHISRQMEDFNVESKMRKVCKMMCVTTNSALMVILWTVTSMSFSGLSAYWLFATWTPLRVYDFLITTFYPMSAVLVLVLLLSPVFAVAGDVRCGNFRLLLSAVIPLNVIGLVPLTVLIVTFAYDEHIISYFFVAGYLLLLLAGGIFQANVIQFGRDVLGDFNSPERSAFVHWYYWATCVPMFVATVIYSAGIAADSITALEVLSIVSGLAMILILIFLLVTCVVHCAYLKIRGRSTVLPRITKNPVAQILRVTRYTLQSQGSPGHCGCLVRFNKIRRSNGGPADDEEVDSVTNFWVLIVLMVSLFGFFFWDDMWAAPLANMLIIDNSILFSLGSQGITSVLVCTLVPIYQLVIRPLLGKHSPPLLWRIFAGLILQLISLVIVTWNVGATIQSSSKVLSDACNLITKEDVNDDTYDSEGVGWFVLAIPQVINGISQLLVFPAVIELILTSAPRAMQGLLIGIWYAMQSIHVIVSVIETATCAVFYWQYYMMKIVLVFVSCITFGIVAFAYKRSQIVHNIHIAQAQGEPGIYRRLQEVDSAESI